MLTISTADHTQSPPEIKIPRVYNAAFDLLQRNLQAGRGDKLAYIDDHTSITYQQLEARSNRFANVLRSIGVKREQRIVLCLHDSIDFPTTFLGAIKAGVVPVVINTLLTPKDYQYMISDSRAVMAVVSAPLLPQFTPWLQTQNPECFLVVSGETNDPLSNSAKTLPSLLDSAPEDFSVVETCADEPCFWAYSSGSTGAPKGTVHAHSSLLQTAELYGCPILGIRVDDVVFSAAKLFFCYGLGNGLLFPMAVGATALLMAERPTPTSVYARLIKHQPTIFYGVPTLYAAMLAFAEKPAASDMNLRICTSAGEPLPEEIGKRWSAHFGVDILDGIGSTEMLHIYVSNRKEDLRYGTTGKPVPGYRIRLVDENEQLVKRGEVGELQVNGPSSAILYFNQRLKSHHTFQGEWTRSGDKYIETNDGYYVYAGRTDDMLKVGGIYVSPIELESALITHESVLEAAVVGKEDHDQLIKPKAYIVLKSGVEANEALSTALKQHVKSLLAPYKYPRWFEFVSELPKTATGKIQRFKLRDKAAKSE